MLYINPQTQSLPTLRETISILRDLAARFPVIHRGPFTPIIDDEDLFELNRTNLMYSIKPNITQQGALYGWMCDFDINHPENFKASIFKDGKPNFLLNNVIKEDVEILFESHPLYRLLQRGINLPGLNRPLRIHNPYGLAHSYGLKSPFISLTSSLEIAAFHACHRYCPVENRFEPITDPDKSGIIFIFELSAPFSMIPNLSTVGKQPFMRPGNNRLFVFQTTPNTNFSALPFVKGFQFRHTQNSTDYFSRIWGNGAGLYPDELVATKISEILGGRRFSEQAFNRNLSYNPQDNPRQNLKKLSDNGYRMEKNYSTEFTIEELERIWFDDVEDIWEDFWDDVVMPRLNHRQTTALMKLPQNSEYEAYFSPQLWQRQAAR